MSKSNSREYSRLERAPIRRGPFAALILVLAVVGVELALRSQRVWFSDLAAWQWKTKAELLEEGALEGDCIVLGTSISFHGVDASAINAQSDSALRVSNLALNGMGVAGQYQILRRYLQRHGAPKIVVLEVSQLANERRRWESGPYWRFWASSAEFSESGAAWSEPDLLVPFAANRLLTSYSFRTSLDNWITSCVRLGGIDGSTRERNETVVRRMRTNVGFDPGTFKEGLTQDDLEGLGTRPWVITRSGEQWFDRILALCAANGIDVVIFDPPMAPEIAARPGLSARAGDIAGLVVRSRLAYPSLNLRVFSPTGYGLEHFADSHHLSAAGGRRLTTDFRNLLHSRK